MKSILFAIIIVTCVLLTGLKDASAKPNCTIFGPKASLVELEASLLEDIESKGLLYVTKLHRTLEIYYDTPQLTLLKDNRFIRFQAREKLGRVKSIAINQQEKLVRKKSKYIREVQMMAKDHTIMTAPLRQYRSASSQIGKHPLLGMIERGNQKAAVAFLKENGIAVPQSLKGMMHVSSSDLYIGVYGKEDERLKGVINFIDSYDTKTGNLIMTRCVFDDSVPIIDEMVEGLGKQFGAQSGLNSQGLIINEYGLLYRQMSKKDRLFGYKMRYPYMFNLCRASFYFLCGLGIIGMFFGKRFFQNKAVQQGIS